MSKPALTAFSVVGTLIVLVLIALFVIFTGAYNVAATAGHTGITRWALNTLQHSSVASRASDIDGVLPTDSASLQHGFEHYHAMCVTCHGAPGVDRGEPGQGMAPTPPELHEEAEEWSDQELFWITKHGIKLAGMPAFGPTHSDEEIWGIAAFVRQLPEISPEDYARRVELLESPQGENPGHTHPPGTAEHEH